MSKNTYITLAIIAAVVIAGAIYYSRTSQPKGGLNSAYSNRSGSPSQQAVNQTTTQPKFQPTGNVDEITTQLINQSSQTQATIGRDDSQNQTQLSGNSQNLNQLDGAYNAQEIQ